MELVIGDFIFISQEEWSSSSDGWVVGVSYTRGNSGYLPANYVERTAETNAWTLHTVLPCDSSSRVDGNDNNKPVQQVGRGTTVIVIN